MMKDPHFRTALIVCLTGISIGLALVGVGIVTLFRLFRVVP